MSGVENVADEVGNDALHKIQLQNMPNCVHFFALSKDE